MFQKFFPGGVGSDIFGEHDTARLPYEDPINEHLRNQYLLNYFQWHFANQKTSPTFQKDLNSLYWAQKMTPVYGIAAFCFAAIVINPNYTRRRSMYLKKFNCFLFASLVVTPVAWKYITSTNGTQHVTKPLTGVLMHKWCVVSWATLVATPERSSRVRWEQAKYMGSS